MTALETTPVGAAQRPHPADVSERIAARVLQHPDVAELHGGPHGTTATYLPGRRVVGVHVGTADQGVQVAVVLHLRRPVREVAAELRLAVAALLTTHGVPVDVLVADVVTAGDAPTRRVR